MAEQGQHSSDQFSENERQDRSPLNMPYLLGELTSAEESVFEQGLTEHSAESAEFEDSMEALTLLAEQIARTMPAPRKALKERVLAAIGQENPRQPKPPSVKIDDMQHVVTAHDGEWLNQATGIDAKVLYQDPVSKTYTLLVNLAPGSEYPAHRHVGLEQCYIVSGDLHVNDLTLGAGDFIATNDGVEHHRTYTLGGCQLLLTTLMDDEFIGH